MHIPPLSLGRINRLIRGQSSNRRNWRASVGGNYRLAGRAVSDTRRQLGLFDATMIVMGGIVGSGIFINPYVVAQHVHTPFLILGVWLMGGVLAMLGAFIWAELATRLPGAGGQYMYLREAYHPSVAFVYGWVLLLVTQTGGMAAVAVTFAHYYREITGFGGSDGAIAAMALLGLTVVNCFGARAGSNVQSALMLMKTAAIAAMVVLGVAIGRRQMHPLPLLDQPLSLGLLGAIAAAMTPVAFAYGGWQTSSFVAAEMRDPRRDLSRGLMMGVSGVVLLYLSVNFVCVKVLGPDGLAATRTPASAVMRAALGDRGARWIAVGIAVSTLGFLSQGILTAPRVYYAMARDGLFFAKRGPAFAAHRSAGGGDRAARRAGHGDRADLAATSRFSTYEIASGFHFVRLHRRGSLFVFAAAKAAAQRHLSHAGPSLHHRHLRALLRRHRRQHHLAQSARHVHRAVDSAERHSRIFVLEPPQKKTDRMMQKHSEYMHWAKTQSRARFNLATSGVGSFPLRELPFDCSQLEINGDNSYGYLPLKQAIAARAGVDPDCVVTRRRHLLRQLPGHGDHARIRATKC